MRCAGFPLLLPLLLLGLSPTPALESTPARGATAPSAAAIAWMGDWDAAFAQAKAEGKPVFLAVNMDGERANDRMAEEVYHDRGVAALTAQCVCLIASRFEHAPAAKLCPRFGSISCAAHRSVDQRARDTVLQPAADGSVIAPQHLFLSPEGKVLMSVPYGISTAQLSWCLATAIRRVNPDSGVSMPARARPPRRLIMDGVAGPGAASASRPLDDAELARTIRLLRSGVRGQERIDGFFRILSTDSPDAVDFLAQELRSGFFSRRSDLKLRLLRAVGRFSPPAFWQAIADSLKDASEEVRLQTAVALEELGAPESVKRIRASYSKEKSAFVRKDLLRALGTAGAADRRARSTLLKAAKNAKEPMLQRNAILALGPHLGDKATDKLVHALLEGDDSSLASCAALAIAFARAEGWEEALKAASALREDPEAALLQRVMEVLEGGNLSLLADDFTRLGGDRLRRERFFGVAPSQE